MTDPHQKQRGGPRPGGGRPKVYETSAARQAAYKARQQRQAQAHAQALAGVATGAALTPEQRAAILAAVTWLGGKHDG